MIKSTSIEFYYSSFQIPEMAVASDSNCVQLMDPEDGTPGAVITRTTATPTCLDWVTSLVASGAR